MSQVEHPRDEFDDHIDEQLDDDFDVTLDQCEHGVGFDETCERCDDEPDLEAAISNCHGFFDGGPGRGVFVCGAVGSEDCDECQFHRDLGLTLKQIGAREELEPE